MSDAQRMMLLREQVTELQRALRAAREENTLLAYERDELVKALKSWAAHPEPQADMDLWDESDLAAPPPTMPLRAQTPRKSRQRMRA